MHSLLARQLKRCFGAAQNIPHGYEDFVRAVDEAYQGFDADRFMLERSLELSSQELLEANTESRAIFQAMPDLLFRLDHEGTILGIKTGFVSELYIPARQMFGKRIQDVPEEGLGQLFQQAIHQVIREKAGVTIEYPLSLQDAVQFYEARLTPLFEDQIVVIIRNISKRKKAEEDRSRLEEQLHQARKMESVGRLAGGVAHDFSNMLQVILGYADLAMAQLTPTHPLWQDLEEIRTTAERSAALTRQLLAFARKQTISPRVLDLNETVSGTLKMLQRLIGENIQLSWVPGQGLWPILMDPTQIDQLLANLTVNARDAINGIGTITIETATTTLDESFAQNRLDCSPGDYVMLAVTDTGCGMDQGIIEHLFEPFFTTKAPGQGTGLGLATVFGIVKQNNGFIEVASRVGQGTVFKLFFPRSDVTPSTVETEETQPSQGGEETVLLVEDEEPVLKLGRRILEQSGYRVLEARTPELALGHARQNQGKIQLLVTDVVMPGMDGRELLRRITPLQSGVRCLFMSGYPAEVIAHHGVLDDGVEFLQKPFTVRTMTEKVRQVLDRPLPDGG